MIDILLVSHGNFAKGMVEGAELIYGEIHHITTLGLIHEEDVEQYYQTMREACIKSLDNKQEVIIFADILGGSPCNSAARIMTEFNEIKCLVGINMPLFLEAITMRESMNSQELMEHIMTVSKESILDLNQLFMETSV